MSNGATIVQKLWNDCNVLRDDGLSYQAYIGRPSFVRSSGAAARRATALNAGGT